MNATALLSSLLFGSAAALGAYAGRDTLGHTFLWIEHDVGDKLRALRIASRGLRRMLIAWLVAIGSIFLSLGVVLQSPLLALAICALIAALPWYIIRRLAERRRVAIEDQLADAM